MKKRKTDLQKASPKAGVGSDASGRRGPSFELPALVLAFLLSLLNLWEFIQNRKGLIILCCVLTVALCAAALILKRPRGGVKAFALLFAAYLLWMAASILWASTGKFFLREFSKQLFALPLVVFLLFFLPGEEAPIRKVLLTLSSIGGVLALLSVDNASIGLSHGLLGLFNGFFSADTGFESGTRLTGILANGNISAGLLALCLFFSFYLLESAETRFQRGYAAVCASFQAFVFLLNFSMGATGFFAVSLIIYLICAGESRLSAFLRMLEVAIPTAIAAFLSFRYFESEGGALAIPLAAMLLDGAVVALLEFFLFPRVQGVLKGRSRITGILIGCAVLVIAVYLALGFLLGGGVTLSPGETLRRSSYPGSGDWTLAVTEEGGTDVYIASQNEQEIIMHTETALYSGPADGAAFTVPEDSRVVYLTFSAPEGAAIASATLSGSREIAVRLGYPLLPGFIANRLQGLRVNQNAIQRAAFFRDGMKVFRDRPVLGGGLGSFESLLFGYQDFYYETKYVHNHYIQVLLDEGIIGFILYLALLVWTLATLWRARKKDAPFRSLYPALCAAFAMIVLHTSMEVVMSVSVYPPFAYTVMALIALCWGRSLSKRLWALISAAVPAAVSLVYTLLIVLNLQATASVSDSSSSYVRFFSALESAAKIDVFEKNDWMASYVNAVGELGLAEYRGKADRYAARLMDIPSNSLHQYLIRYYLSFGEVSSAYAAADRGTDYASADSRVWNSYFALFSDACASHPELRQEVLGAVSALNRKLQVTQERLMDGIVLDEVSKNIISLAVGA